MSKLTTGQAVALFEIVKFANINGGKIPSGPEFAAILGGITPRGALAQINRLIKNNHLPLEADKKRYLDYGRLITERESAVFCLDIYKISCTSNYGRTTRDEVAKRLNLPPEGSDKFLKLCCEAGYLNLISSAIDAVRSGEKIFNQIEYLKLLANS